jgi:hypothetical protein
MEPMAETFLEMMDAMADAYSRFRGRGSNGYIWHEPPPVAVPELPPDYYAMGLPSPFAHMPLPSLSQTPRTILEGWWLGESGEVLAFKGERFRIYVGPHDYREGRFRVADWLLAMENPDDGTRRQYDFALREDYLALRDDGGNILYYVQVTP